MLASALTCAPRAQVVDERLRYELRPDLQERQPQAGTSLPEPGEATYGQWSGGAADAGWPRVQQWQVRARLRQALGGRCGHCRARVLAQRTETTRAIGVQDNVYPAEYDIPAERSADDGTGAYQRYGDAPPELDAPGTRGAADDADFRPTYAGARAEEASRETGRAGSRAAQWGRGWSTGIDVEASDDWD